MSAHASAALSMRGRRVVCMLLAAFGCGLAIGADDRDALSRKMPPFRLMLASQMTDEPPLQMHLSGALAALPVTERSLVVLGFSYAALLEAAPLLEDN
ncbi:MAG: hypothetical protein IPN40_14300 [Uliginosibacterium sp.]|nr:hypothetical protein [Uliginosibacterium sp.]